MVVFRVSKEFSVKSHKGSYDVVFAGSPPEKLASAPNVIYVVDDIVLDLHADKLRDLFEDRPFVAVCGDEATKSLENIHTTVGQVLEAGCRRNSELIAVGGGTVQDLTCFLATVLMRGVSWSFVPTTLLAQTDSCIGSKSSINCAGTKNILGSFWPPQTVWVDTEFLSTLPKQEMLSGLGEILKVHVIGGKDEIGSYAEFGTKMIDDHDLLGNFTFKSLDIKRRYIELDEFDLGPRNVFNYGHCIGHALEAATKFGIPHGIAVAMGIYAANSLAVKRKADIPRDVFLVNEMAKDIFQSHLDHRVSISNIFSHMGRDKKNDAAGVANVILPQSDLSLAKISVELGPVFANDLADVLKDVGLTVID